MNRKLLAVLLCSFCAWAADWPQWRGLNRDGISPETGLLKKWPDGGPKLVWKTQGLGEGYCSLAIAQGKIFTQGQRGDEQFVIALEAAAGKRLWQTANGSAFRERRGHGPRGVPTVDGDRLYALAADGTLAAMETATGKALWRVNIVKEYRGAVPNWGISESPLVDGERLVVMPGGSGAGVVALEKRSGKLVWKSQSDEAGYSSAILATAGGVRLILALTGERAMGLRADNGELLWRYERVSNRTANIATPVFRDGHAFFSTDYGTGAALLKLTAVGGAVKATEVYFSRDMRNHYNSSLLIGDYLYGFSSSILTAMKFLTGEVAWRDRSVGKGNVIYADGHLYALGEDGVVGLVEATPAAYRETSRFTIAKGERPTWAPPAISNGRLYLRDQENLYCYDIRGPGK